ncbi:Listeria/Bacterioides repeat-containing protein [Fibrobacter sp. UWT2]|uniref:InlB B-repeat-containing protein n=1 Tax=Fibrobacter sp. UWT2 TaxID=1896224 RepID=UPI00091C7CAA|nr:InlB B-repeat-containing protein [Fibrobacter sp. UWT2]SHL05640.1 Listeria/Bacterioides repeat-containing protein [Fibrobacter sp. UWT2]
MDTGKISLGKLLALLIFMVGIQSAWADVWDGTTKTPAKKQTIDGKEYFLIDSAANLAWFSDTVNNYVLEAKWQRLISLIEADTSKAEYRTRAFKDSAINLMKAIRQDPESYYLDPAKKALWNKGPYTGYLRSAWDFTVNVELNAKITAEYLDMNNKPFTPIAAGNGTAKYTGTFLGNGITIKNLKVDSKEFVMQVFDVVHGNPSYCQNVGLFGVIGSGTVRNLILDGVTIYATGKNDYWANPHQVSVGPIVGWMTGGTIDTCYTSGKIVTNGRDVGAGGILGAMTDGKTVSNALSTASIEASGRDVYVGGISGVIRGGVTISSSVYDGDNLEAHPDEIGAQGAIAGRIVNNRDTSKAQSITITLSNCYYDTDALNNDIWVGSLDVYVNVVGDPKGFNNVNTEENACLLNKHTWDATTKTCSDSTGLWTNQENIAITGVSKKEDNSNAETVFLITFDANGGSFAPGSKTTKELKFNTPLTADEISTPTYDSTKSFVGWALSPTASAPENLGVVYGVKKVYAVWKDVVLYTITFDLNNGDGAAKYTKKVVKDSTITTAGFTAEQLPSVYKVGNNKYYFAGWSDSENGLALENLGVATKDATFYARWSPAPQFKVKFDVQGHGTAPADQVIYEEERATAPEEPVANGYQFKGWFVEAACTNSYNFQTPVTSEITLFAKWVPVLYSLTYNLNGGTDNGANPINYTIESETVLLKTPTIANDTLEFKGWFYDGAFTNQALQITKGSFGDVTLYAYWRTKEYTINYQAGEEGANNVAPVVKKYGEDIALLGAVYKRAGYEQDGWSTVDNGDKAYELNALYTENKNVTLFPHWEKTVYKIIYELDGGVNHVDNDTTYTMDSSDVVLKNPTKVGYKFEGWYDAEVGGKKVTKVEIKAPYGDVKLYAKWSQTKVTVTLQDNSCEYNGKNCGAKYTVSVTNGSLGSDYKTVVVTDSIKNVFDGPIDANIVSFAIVNKTTGDTVTSAFDVTFVDGGSISVSPKLVNFTTDNIPSKTYTGDSIHVEGKSKTSDLTKGHTHNVGYTVDVLDAGDNYDPVMTDPAEVKILDADGNGVTANYTIGSIAPPAKKFVVEKSNGNFEVVFADEYVTDDGAPHSMTHGASSDAPGTTFMYQMDGGEWTDKLSSLVASGVGDHTIKVVATNPNYKKTQEKTAKLMITASPVVTIVAVGDSKVYDGTPLSATFTTSGNLGADDQVVDVEFTNSITDVGTVTSSVKSYKIMNGTTNVTDLYKVNKVDCFLSVTKAPLTITTASDSKAYDGNPLTAGVTAVFVNGETATVVATGSQKMVGSSKNTYDIQWDATAKQGNYQIVENLGILTVTKAAVTIKVSAAEKLYGDADPEFTGEVTGLVNPDDLGVIKYYRSNANVKNAGSYPKAISASYTANMNYEVNVTKGNLTVKKRNVTLTSADASKVYDGTALTAPTVTVGGDGFAPNEGAYFTVTGSQTVAGTSANTFTYELKEGTDVSTNYTLAEVKGDLTVTKSPVTVSIVGRTGTYAYNGSQQVVSGYDASINNAMYSASDIVFGGESVIQKTKSGTYAMGLTSAMFTNKNNNFDVTFDVTDGSLTITPPEIVVAYNDAGDTLHVIVGDDDSDSVINEKINDALAGHVPPIALPTKDEDKDSTYAFDGWEKNPTSGQYEPVFDATVKKDTIDVKYQDDPEKHIDVEIHVTDVHKDIVEKINAALEQNGIALPSKPDNGDSTYVLDWKQNPETGVYEPDFKGVLRVEQIIVKYGDGATDTIYVDIRAQDSKSQIEQKINDALNNHLPPIKVKGKDDTYTLAGWEKDEATGYYVPVFAKGDVVYVINFHLPEGAVLTSKFNGYNYGEVTLLPDAVMKSDTTWVFNGWYTKTKGRGDRVKAMRETDAGNKSLYPLFQKTLRYEIAGKTGEVVVIYTDRADTTIARALKSVIPDEISKNGVRYAFVKWKLEDGVYKAVLKSLAVRFNVAVDARALNIEEAQMGSRYAVFDMDGRVVKRGTVSNGSQRVEIPKSGSYMVRVGKDAVQVNVK